MVLACMATLASAQDAAVPASNKPHQENRNKLWTLLHDECAPTAARKLYPPAPCVEVNTDHGTADGYVVTLDTGPVSKLIDSMPASRTTWDMARYNAWLSGKDSYTEQLQHVSKVLGEKYSRNLQLLDTLFKALSSSIDSIGEADRTFVNNF